MFKFTGRFPNPILSVLKMIQPLSFPPAHHFHPLLVGTSSQKYHNSDFYNIRTKMFKFTGRFLNPILSVLK